MSQIRRSHEDRVAAVRCFGYSEREASFLCLAALHGGYFLRRQYCQFLGKEVGGTAAALVQKAVALEHAKVSVYEHNTHVYHLCTRPFYAVLGQVDNRNRRDRQPSTIKNKLMGLDFVLAHPENLFLATEQEKLDYFTNTLQIGLGKLPTKLYHSSETQATTTRYFVDKYPIFLSAPSQCAPPVVSFCVVGEGLTTMSRFETYLNEYGRLFASMPRFNVLYVAATPVPFRAAERTFGDFLAKIHGCKNGAPTYPSTTRLIEHFAARQQYETKQFASFDRSKLIRLRNEREEFSGEKYDGLYERWTVGGEAAVLEILAPDPRPLDCSLTSFSTHLLEHNYDLFGSLTAF